MKAVPTLKMASGLLALFLVTTIQISAEIVEFDDNRQIDFPGGYYLVDDSGKTIKRMPDARTAVVRAFRTHRGGKEYMSDWSWERFKSSNIPPSWIRAIDSGKTTEQREQSKQRGMSMFFIEYAVVQENAFAGDGKFDELMLLAELSQQHADFIAEFWRTRALMEVREEVSEVVARVVKNADGKDKEATQREAQQKAAYLFYSYYYDHWEQINEMIMRSLAKQQAEAEQGSAGQPATRSESDSEGGDKPQPEADVRSR